MKKNTIKAFTLVEMLIVIVIIGILIAALMPRMQSAQGRARDVARKTALSQIQSAIVTSQTDKGEWPKLASGVDGLDVGDLKEELLAAGMNGIPKDPLSSSTFEGLGTTSGSAGEYRYVITKRNGTDKGGFVLMAKTEVEGGSNWVVCDNATNLTGGKITSSDDIKDIVLCSKLSKAGSGENCTSNTTECKYTEEGQLRYIVVY